MRSDEGSDVGEDNVGRDMNKTVTQSEIEITAPIGTHHTKLDVYLTPSALHLKNLI